MAAVTKPYFRVSDKLRFELSYDLTKKFQNTIGIEIAQERRPCKSLAIDCVTQRTVVLILLVIYNHFLLFKS